MKDNLAGAAGFQWDKGNAEKSLTAHQVENWECEQVFFNEPLVILDDPGHSHGEKRWAAFGITDAGRSLVVIFTMRGQLLRVISAGDTNKKERGFYENER
jgi:uncharacterized DUF497 family protein